MSRKINRDTRKRVSSSGYQQMQGDVEVQGNLIGPAITSLSSAIAKLAATSTTPVKLAAPVAEGIYKSVILKWTKQYNLSNLDYYEMQVSLDDLAWYSLKMDGQSWGGDNLGATTRAVGEFLVHPNIPFIGTADDPVGRKLYYRVRQHTKSNKDSEWSDSTDATPSTVQSGDLAANSVYANNITTGAITTEKIAAGAVTADEIASHTITADEIAAGTLTATEINASVITLISDAQDAADAAQADADTAQADADTANGTLADIASDSLLTPVEKPPVIREDADILAEQAGIDARATAFAITTLKTTYDTAVSALTTYLATLTTPVLWSNLAGNTTIVGATFRTKFSDVYAARQALLNEIAKYAETVDIVDVLDRVIKISPADGIYAEDEDGNIIHDIPNAPILAGMAYGGHVLWFDAPDIIETITLTYTDTATSFAVNGATTNTTIAEHLPTGLTNIHGAIVGVRLSYYIAAAKTHTNANCYGEALYSTVYNTAPGSFNKMSFVQGYYSGVAHAFNHTVTDIRNALVPVVYNGATPYITWNVSGGWYEMSADSAQYYVMVGLYLLGVTI